MIGPFHEALRFVDDIVLRHTLAVAETQHWVKSKLSEVKYLDCVAACFRRFDVAVANASVKAFRVRVTIYVEYVHCSVSIAAKERQYGKAPLRGLVQSAVMITPSIPSAIEPHSFFWSSRSRSNQ